MHISTAIVFGFRTISFFDWEPGCDEESAQIFILYFLCFGPNNKLMWAYYK